MIPGALLAFINAEPIIFLRKLIINV